MSDRVRWWRSRPARIVRAVLIGIGIPFVLLGVLAMAFGDRFIFLPSRFPEGEWQAREHARIPVDEVEYTVADGTRLVAWHSKPPNARCTFLYFHGNAGNISHRLSVLEALASIGVAVFGVDYRGYGKSGGSPSEKGILTDGEGSWGHLTVRVGEPPERIVLFGKSLGGVPAIDLAAKVKCRGLIVQSSFTSIPDIASRAIPIFPFRWFLKSTMDNRKRIAAARCPVLVVHSRDDEIIPFDHGVKLHAAAPAPNWFAEFEGVGHNDLIDVRREEWLRDLDQFLNRIGLPRRDK
jgi:hypothetical protein